MRAFRQSGIGQLVFGAIVVAIILAFMLSGRGPNVSDGLTEECAVEVGDHCIEPKEFFAAYGLVSSIGLNDKAAEQMRLKETVARGLAERELLLDEAKRLGLGTSDDAVDAELAEGRTRVSLPAASTERNAASFGLCVEGPAGCEPGTLGLRGLPVKKAGQFDFDLYKRMVRVATGRSPSLFKEMQAREITAERVRELIRSGVRVSEEEAYLSYSRARSQVTARYAKVQTSWFERYVVTPTAAEQEKWSKEHEAELKLALDAAQKEWKVGCPVVQEIRLEPEGSETPDDLLARAKTLRQKFPASDFDKQARALSRAESATVGGRVGCLDEKFGPGFEELTKAVSELKAGDVSEPVVTLRGVYLVRLIDKVTAENVAALTRDYFTYKLTTAALAQDAARAFATELIAELKAKKPLAETTDALLKKALAQGPLGEKENPGEKAEDRPQSDISRAFSIEQSPWPDAVGDTPATVRVFALENVDDVVAEPIPLRSGFVVAQLKEKDLATREKFAEDRDRLLAALRARKAEEILRQEVARLVDKAGGVRFNEKYVPPEKKAPATGGLPGGITIPGAPG